MLTLCALLASSLALPVENPPIVVDAAGGGDFTDLQAAIDAAANGDVLMVLPGQYAAFALDKRLAILGPADGPKPTVPGLSTVTAPGEVTLSGLHIEALSASNVEGRLTLDACDFTPLSTPAPGSGKYAVLVKDCPRVELVGCTLENGQAMYQLTAAALMLERTSAWINGCDIQGYEWSPVYPEGCYFENGSPGIRAFRSHLHIEATSIRGGDGLTTSDCDDPFSTFYGGPGDAIHARQSTVRYRGTPGTVLAGGTNPFGLFQTYYGAAIELTDGSVAWLSSVAYTAGGEPVLDAHSALHEGDDAPVLERLGSGAPGGTYTLRSRAPVGEVGIVAIALPGGALDLPGWAGPLLITEPLIAALPVVGAGLDTPVDISIPVPPMIGLAGLGALVRAQAFYPWLPGLTDPEAAEVAGGVPLLLGF